MKLVPTATLTPIPGEMELGIRAAAVANQVFAAVASGVRRKGEMEFLGRSF